MTISQAQNTRNPLELDGDPIGASIHALVSRATLNEKVQDCHEADIIAHGAQCRDLLAINSNARQSVITKEILAQRWFTGLEAAS